MALLIGIIIGTVLGLTGAGGSVFAVPLLMFFLDLPLNQAAGISLGAVSASALFGVSAHLKSRQIQWLPAIVFASLGSACAPIGSWLGQHISEQALVFSFSILVMMIAWRMWTHARKQPEDTRIVRARPSEQTSDASAMCVATQKQRFEIGLPCIFAISGGAVVTGLLSGLFGVGGGFLIIPTLLYLTAISMKQAVATSLAIISAISTTGFFSFLFIGNEVNTQILIQVAAGGVTGMIIGIFAGKRLAGPNLQRLFALLMIPMVIMLISSKLV